MAEESKPEFRADFQFRLWHLLYLMAFYASGFVVAPISWVLTTGWLVIFVIALCQSTRLAGFKFLFWVVLIPLVFGSCLLPTVGSRPATRRTVCKNNLRQIMLAMMNYESTFGQLPPASILDSEGKPKHSWRVLLLPYLEGQKRYASYDFNEPWDGPNNRLLMDPMPTAYQCPSSKHPQKTHYKLVTGPGTAFQDGVKMRSDRIADGASNCAAIVEDAEPVDWMQPSDLTIDEAIELFAGEVSAQPIHENERLFTKRSMGTNVGLLDASAIYLDPINDPDELRKLFGINNGLFDPDRLRLGGGRIQIKHRAKIAAVIYVLFGLVPLYLLATKELGPMFIRSFRLDPSTPANM